MFAKGNISVAESKTPTRPSGVFSSQNDVFKTPRTSKSRRTKTPKKTLTEPKNALIVDFEDGFEAPDVDTVRKEFERFGKVRCVTFCFIDRCQCFIVLKKRLTEKIIDKTSGILLIDGQSWSIRRPEDARNHRSCAQNNRHTIFDGPSPLRPSRIERLANAATLFNIYQTYRWQKEIATSSSVSTMSMVSSLASSSATSSTDVYSPLDSDKTLVEQRLTLDSDLATLRCASVSDLCPLPAESFESVVSFRSTNTAVAFPDYPIAPVEYYPGFLPLAPPYHILPDTPYFRSAHIIPPPARANCDVSLLQRITNRYLESMEIHDDQQYKQIDFWGNGLMVHSLDKELPSEESVISNASSFCQPEILRCPWWRAYE